MTGGIGTPDCGSPLSAYWYEEHAELDVTHAWVTLRVTFDTMYVGVQPVPGAHVTPLGMLVGVGEMQLTLGWGRLVELRLSERTS